MDKAKMATVLRAKAQEIQDSEAKDRLDTAELINVLARVVEGKPIERAFGAPGDWGYGTPIGDALAGR